jgi:S1-C subfamily serine protease
VPGGPADLAGLKAGTKNTSVTGLKAGGDMIIEADGRPVLTYGDVVGYIMANKSPGDKIVFKVLRGNEQKELTLTLIKRPR